MQRRVTDRIILKGYSPYCLFLYQMLQVLVTSDALQLVLDYLLNIFLDLVVVVLNGLLHAVVAIGILEVVDDRDWLIMAFLSLHLVGIHDNLGMEDILAI